MIDTNLYFNVICHRPNQIIQIPASYFVKRIHSYNYSLRQTIKTIDFESEGNGCFIHVHSHQWNVLYMFVHIAAVHMHILPISIHLKWIFDTCEWFVLKKGWQNKEFHIWGNHFLLMTAESNVFIHFIWQVETVYYPGLPSHPQHEVAKKQMKDYGGMVVFEMKGGMKAAKTLVEVNIFEPNKKWEFYNFNDLFRLVCAFLKLKRDYQW